jgi:hypothetical protein
MKVPARGGVNRASNDCPGSIIGEVLTTVPQAEAFPKARDAAAKAVALDDSLAEAHLSIAEVKLYQDWDFTGAEKEFKDP